MIIIKKWIGLFKRQNKLDIVYKLSIKINLFLFILVLFGLN